MKIAVLGTGSAGLRHLRALAKIENVIPVAVPVRENRIGELELKGITAFSDLKTACAFGVSAAIVATNTVRHYEDVICAFDHDLDVLVEKPMALDFRQAEDMHAESNLRGLGLYVGCILRFSQSLNRFRSEINHIGQVHAVQIEARSYLPDWRPGHPYQESYSAKSDEGGVLRDLIHEIDYAGWIFGWPEFCQADITNLNRIKIKSEEIVQMHWRSPIGTFVSIGLDYLTRPPIRKVSAYGEYGTVTWDAFAQKVVVELVGLSKKDFLFEDTLEECTVSMLTAFSESRNGNADDKLASSRDGCNAMSVCYAANLSSDAKCIKKVSYINDK